MPDNQGIVDWGAVRWSFTVALGSERHMPHSHEWFLRVGSLLQLRRRIADPPGLLVKLRRRHATLGGGHRGQQGSHQNESQSCTEHFGNCFHKSSPCKSSSSSSKSPLEGILFELRAHPVADAQKSQGRQGEDWVKKPEALTP